MMREVREKSYANALLHSLQIIDHFSFQILNTQT